MVNLKSLFLNFCATFLFTVSFTALFLALAVYFLPADFQELRSGAEQELPRRLANNALVNSTLGTALDRSLPINVSATEFARLLPVLQAQCTSVSAGDEVAAALCQQLQEGKLQSREDVQNAMKEQLILPQLKEAIGGIFIQLERPVRQAQGYLLPLLAVFLVPFILGTLVVALDTWNLRSLMYNMAGYTWAFGLATFLPLLVFWIAIPWMSGWLLGQVEKIGMQQLANAGEGLETVPLDQIGGTVRELVQLIGDFMLEFLRKSIFKQMIVWGIISTGALGIRWISGRGREKMTGEEKKEQTEPIQK